MPSHAAVTRWVKKNTFIDEFTELLKPVFICPHKATYWPNATDPSEKSISNAEFRDWWAPNGGKIQTWDILMNAKVAHEDTLVDAIILVEAKAHHNELSPSGKSKPGASDSQDSHDNHRSIQHAIKEAEAAWQTIDPDCRLSEISHYQLANRMAAAWKLAHLGIPVVLVYLGVLNDAPTGKTPFVDDADWQTTFHTKRTHSSKTHVPDALFERKILIDNIHDGKTPIWLLSRSISV